jgi:hypothetical protein
MSTPVWRHDTTRYLSQWRGTTARRRTRAFIVATNETLEARLVMNGAAAISSAPAIQMLSASTTDSKSVTIEYQVNQTAGATKPIQFGIYRSKNDQFDSSDSLVDTVTVANPAPGIAPSAITSDQNGQPAAAAGKHELTIPLPAGLPPFPEMPYVLVVADPSSPAAMTDPQVTASFRVYTIGIVTHGGIQDPNWIHGPPWELETAYKMRHEGFDSVIAYNWAVQSSTPGAAIKQSPRLARMILEVATKFPANAPVDLEFIGHSEGTVVNTYAMVKLESEMTPQLKAGYIEDFLLDPHAANDNIPGQQMSVAGFLSGLAKTVITDYQGIAKDPPVFVPSIVDEVFVLFQHSRATAGGIYNLWGQVPVKTDGPLVHYYNLTDMGVTHSGKTGVNYWFRDFIAPTLGDQAPLVTGLELNGQIDNADPAATASVSAVALARRADNLRANRVYGPEHVVQSNQPEFSGTAAPGSIIRLGLSPSAKPMKLALAGVTTANSAGQWTLIADHPLKNGQYRTLVTAFSRKLTTRPGLGIVPTQPLGRLVVAARPG